MTTRTITLDHDRPLTLTLAEAGSGRPALILHGGGGPLTVAGIADHLSGTMHTITPAHPGWNGTERPEWLSTIRELAGVYRRLIVESDLEDVLVIGSSVGGWVAAEMAASDEAHLIAGLVLIDAVGIAVEGEPIRDFFALDARGVAEFSYHDAERFYVDPSTIPADQLAVRQANMATMRLMAGFPYMHDPSLRDRLASIRVPTLAIWGESDRIVTPAYGSVFAAAIPNGQFAIVDAAGHLPQIEQPVATLALIDDFLEGLESPGS